MDLTLTADGTQKGPAACHLLPGQKILCYPTDAAPAAIPTTSDRLG